MIPLLRGGCRSTAAAWIGLALLAAACGVPRPPTSPPAAGTVPVPERVELRLARAGEGVRVRHVVVLRHPGAPARAEGVVDVLMPPPLALQARLDGREVAADVSAALGTAHVRVPVALAGPQAELELRYRLPLHPDEPPRIQWSLPWSVERLAVGLLDEEPPPDPADAGLVLAGVSLDGRPLSARVTAEGRAAWEAADVPEGAALAVEVIAEGMQTEVPGGRAELQVVDIPAEGHAALHVAGGHAAVTARQEVTSPAGPATLLRVDRTPPAAAGSADVTREWWLFVLRPHPSRADMRRAFALRVVVTGDEHEARRALLRIAAAWGLP